MSGSPYKKRKVSGVTHSEHRLVYEQHHGLIPDGYHVHHRDFDKRNNDPSNLVALTPAEHSRIHNDRYPRVRNCDVCGREYEPAPTKRSRSKTCSRECFRQRMSDIRKSNPVNRWKET